ncbi:hypothetical protein FYJ62_05330 [Lactobacillus porci]|uniref:Uncharacterized protein n=1 Tax=Lactobacillus porci TaxID=2012477 RepID=A0A6A8ME71_9LACO|nr:hypothetical protein [Lactobacillus porci]
MAEVKPAFLLVLSSKLNSSAKTEVSLFITEVPPPTIPPSRIDCCLMVRFLLLTEKLKRQIIFSKAKK